MIEILMVAAMIQRPPVDDRPLCERQPWNCCEPCEERDNLQWTDIIVWRTILDPDYQCGQRGEGWRWTGEECVAVPGRCPVCGAKGIEIRMLACNMADCDNQSPPFGWFPAWQCPHDGLLFTAPEGKP